MVQEATQADREFIHYPTNMLVGVIDEADAAQAALHELTERGFNADEIRVLCGPEGAKQLDVSGREHGILGRLSRLILNVADAESESIRRHEQELEAGHFLVAIPAAEPAARERAREILLEHGGHYINFFGAWIVETLDP
jgi:hypothetical protein